MRSDAVGLFWEDTPRKAAGPKAEKPKRSPPEAVWLSPTYLPGYEEGLRFDVELMTDAELIAAQHNRERLTFDVEIYSNYFIVGFKSIATGKVLIFERDIRTDFNALKLRWVMENFVCVGFNSNEFDIPIISMALAGHTTSNMKEAANCIIHGMRPYEILRKYKVKGLENDSHIDLIEVAPLVASLKIYGGRMHVPRMQDLPFHPETVLNEEQKVCVRWYNINDLVQTQFLHTALEEQIVLRQQLTKELGTSVLSRSDAQIAEVMITTELFNMTRRRLQRPTIRPGTTYKYIRPSYMEFKTDLLKWVLDIVVNADFVVSEKGSVIMPPAIKELELQINGTTYTMGIGGLHSNEKSASHCADDEFEIIDKDVTSYYPYIILNLGLYPAHLGQAFLRVYKGIVERRIAAKNRGDKAVADSLKITVNGAFGKLANKHSMLYSPNLMFQVTVTGQLTLLMLIEAIELAGIHVVSANTDGVVIHCPRRLRSTLDEIVVAWEKKTRFSLEEACYEAIYSRDVNNYIAVKKDGTTKNKGAFANPWKTKKLNELQLHKNPFATICIEAVEALIIRGVPLAQTIRTCTDIRKFICVRYVKGGAVKVWDRLPPPTHGSKEELLEMAGFYQFSANSWAENWDKLGRTSRRTEVAYALAVDLLSKPGQCDYLGKAIRWYYASGVTGDIVYASNGNRVPRTEGGAKPLMELPGSLPDDINFEWYEKETEALLQDLGYA